MTTLTTRNELNNAVVTALMEALEGKTFDCVGEMENEFDGVYPEVEVIYNHDAWNILGNSDFDDCDGDELDFSGCDNAMQCVVMEAQACVNATIRNIQDSTTADLINLMDEAFSIDWRNRGDLYAASVEVHQGGSVLDNVTHNYEDEISNGAETVAVCFYAGVNKATFSLNGFTCTITFESTDEDEDDSAE